MSRFHRRSHKILAIIIGGSLLCYGAFHHTFAGVVSPPNRNFFDNNAIVLSILISLLILSGLFSASEIALVSLPASKVRAMLEAGISGSKSVDKIKSNPNRMLITILLGNNLANIGASVMTAVWTSTVFGESALALVTALLTLLVLVFGEIFPKSFAQQHAESFACWVARPLLMLELLFYPIIWMLELVLRGSLRLAGRRQRVKVDALKELEAMIDILTEQGRIEDNVQQLISGTFIIGKKTVSEIMTTRSKIIAIEINASLKELRKLFLVSGKSRIPVFKEDLDHIDSIVNMRMLLKAEDEGKTIVNEMVRIEPIKVDSAMCIDDLLVDFQQQRQQMAIVYDKRKRVKGLVTVENVLEEIVGELFDEKERYRVFVKSMGRNHWEVTGDCPLYEFRKYYPEFEPEQPPFKSIAAFFIDSLQGLPIQKGSRFEKEGYVIEVLEFKENNIVRLSITKLRKV